MFPLAEHMANLLRWAYSFEPPRAVLSVLVVVTMSQPVPILAILSHFVNFQRNLCYRRFLYALHILTQASIDIFSHSSRQKSLFNSWYNALILLVQNQQSHCSRFMVEEGVCICTKAFLYFRTQIIDLTNIGLRLAAEQFIRYWKRPLSYNTSRDYFS